LPAASTGHRIYVEDGYPAPVFRLLKRREVPFQRGPASPFTGLVGALVEDEQGRLHVVQDSRRAGFARAE
jgi:hypothetical protein